MLYLFYRDLNSFTIKQSEEPVAKIYFKKNTAQRKFADNDIWEVLTNSSDIYDGDRIRTSKNSEAYTEFNDSGVQIQLREKSMVQIFKNKNQRSIDFIGGEIFVANNSPEEKIVVRSGKKEIAVSQASEVKLALPEVSEAAAAGAEEAAPEDNTVVIEVVSGQVEVTEQPVDKRVAREAGEVREALEAAPIVVSAGEKITLVPTVVEIAKAKAKAAAAEVEKISKESVETAIEETVEETVEENVEEPAAAEAVVESVVEAVVVPETAKPKSAKLVSEKREPEPSTSVAVQSVPNEPVVIPVEPISVGVEKTFTKTSMIFTRNDYDRANHKYNYGLGCNLFEVSEKNKTIPAGAVLEFTMKGTASRDISRWAIQISTGEKEWVQAHPFKNSYGNDGTGIKANTPFTYTAVYVLDKTIVNTDSSWVNICYDPDIMDESAVINNFEVSAKVLSIDKAAEITKITSGFTKTLEYETITFPLNQWGKKADEYDFRIDVDASDIFGALKSISKGSKIKITISGSCDRMLYAMRPELEDSSNNTWIQILMNDANRDYEAAKINGNTTTAKNKQFSFSKEYKAYTDLPDTTYGMFHLILDSGGNKKNPTFTNLKISFEVE